MLNPHGPRPRVHRREHLLRPPRQAHHAAAVGRRPRGHHPAHGHDHRRRPRLRVRRSATSPAPTSTSPTRCSSCGTAAEVSAVNSVDDRAIPCPGPMTTAIAEEYATHRPRPGRQVQGLGRTCQLTYRYCPASVDIFDTTLRDGAQFEGISLSVDDKLRIAEQLDWLGVRYVEGGYPQANPKDEEFFRRARTELRFETAELVAFGSTRRPAGKVDVDPTLQALVEAGAPDRLHRRQVVGLPRHRGAAAPPSTRASPWSATRCGSSGPRACGCSSTPSTSSTATRPTPSSPCGCSRRRPPRAPRCSCCATPTAARCPTRCSASSARSTPTSAPTSASASTPRTTPAAPWPTPSPPSSPAPRQLQGTINGYGERTGNANLMTCIPNLELKLGIRCLPEGRLERLTAVSRHVAELVNLPPHDADPYVGPVGVRPQGRAAHLGARQGRRRHLRARRPRRRRQPHPGARLRPRRPRRHGDEGQGVRRRARRPRRRRARRAAQASSRAAGLRVRGGRRLARAADAPGHRLGAAVVHASRATGSPPTTATTASRPRPPSRSGSATTRRIAVGEGNGPVNALDAALRIALNGSFPALEHVHLTDYKVRILDDNADTDAVVRVLIESTNGDDIWTTIGVEHQHHRGVVAGARRLPRLRPPAEPRSRFGLAMAAPEYVPVKPLDDVRAYESPPRRPDQWRADRPGDLVGRPARRATASASRAPTRATPSSWPTRCSARSCSPARSSVDDAIAGCLGDRPQAGVALRPGARSPTTCGSRSTLWGFLDASPPMPSWSTLREAWFAEVAHPHHYAEARRIVDAVPERRCWPSRHADDRVRLPSTGWRPRSTSTAPVTDAARRPRRGAGSRRRRPATCTSAAPGRSCSTGCSPASTGGEFLLRIEDTDTERNQPELIDDILDSIRWLGLGWDGEPVHQSDQRAPPPRGRRRSSSPPAHAFWSALAAGARESGPPERRADRPRRRPRAGRGPGPALPGARRRARRRSPTSSAARCPSTHADIEDFVLVRANGTPMFLLANAVDDADMGITHVLRGEEHVNGTPKYLLIQAGARRRRPARSSPTCRSSSTSSARSCRSASTPSPCRTSGPGASSPRRWSTTWRCSGGARPTASRCGRSPRSSSCSGSRTSTRRRRSST